MAGRPHTATMSAPASSRTQQQRQMDEWVFSITSNMTTTVSSWGEEMSLMSSENKRLSEELHKLRLRTAGISEKLAVRDQQHVEDLNDPNRPSKISERYLQFTDGERIDAIDALNDCCAQNKGSNPRLVCETFQIAYEVATEAMSNVQENLLQTLKSPPSARAGRRKEATGVHLKHSTSTQSKTGVGNEHLRNIMESASAYLRKTSDKVDTSAMEEDVLEILQGRPIYREHHYRIEKSSSKLFIPVLCKMAWQLAVQAPYLRIEYRQMTFSPVMHEPTTKSSPMPGTPIKYYLWPALLDGQNGTVLRKGRARI